MTKFKVIARKNYIDLFCGIGGFHQALDKLGCKCILACDIEEIAIKVAKDNQNFNNSNIKFYQNNEAQLNIPKNYNHSFDLIVSNILATPLILMKNSIKSLCHSKTRVILSGFLEYQKEEIESHYVNIGFEIEKEFSENNWVALVLRSKR